jgi:hypothetical protein
MLKNKKYRILVLVYPIEKYVGHWACSSESIELARIIMEGEDIKHRIKTKILELKPHAIAIIGKKVAEYHSLLDQVLKNIPEFKNIPRIYRCQNTVLARRIGASKPSKETLSELDHWFKFATHPKFSLVLVQTLTDVDLISEALDPTMVAACPYGYDKTIFDPDLSELERSIDVGCYFNLRNDDRRKKLVEKASKICKKNNWTFKFELGKYWHDYANLIRRSKICLHHSDQQEVPFRIYETTCFGTVFVTDPLTCKIETLFEKDKEYLTYQPDFSNLELVLGNALNDKEKWLTISKAGKKKARNYSWDKVAETYVVPALEKLLKTREK